MELKNDILTVNISTKGAEMQSVKKNGCEMLWQGDPDVWGKKAPVLFPICGGLKDDEFTFMGKSYTLLKHGFARDKEFILEKSDSESAVFLLTEDEESLSMFPFKFEFRIIYRLSGSRIDISYSVKNNTDVPMYFSVGSHEGYACPEGIEEYSIKFEKDEPLFANVLNGNILSYETYEVPQKDGILDLKYKYFDIDALVFTGLSSRSAELINRKTGNRIKVEFKDEDYLLLWTKPGAGYICIEPWCGVPDFEDSTKNIAEKKGILRADVGETVIKSHSITF